MLSESRKAAGVPAAGEIDVAPFGKEANRPCLELLITYSVQQGLIPRPVAVDELW
jgi:4,5-dihydroxyphthalate decarboxylase